MKNFRTYQIAVEFYRLAETLSLPRHLKDQLSRASSSIALNLTEGVGRVSPKDKNRFYRIALGSLRECQAILDLVGRKESDAWNCADKLGAHLYKLIRS